MASSSKTPNLGLSQWSTGDKPSFLSDINNDFAKIDEVVSGISTTPVAPTEPDDASLGLTAAQYARLWVDADGIVRVKA